MGDSSSSASYIHLVQHLIEKCLLFHMTKEECMEALFKHANIKTVITSTVWKELEKENKDFFEAYYVGNKGGDRMSESETTQKIQKMLSESSATTELSATSPAASCGSSIGSQDENDQDEHN